MKCPICGKEFPKGWRAVHAHMMKDHLAEYRAKGCKLSAFGIDTKAPGQQPKQEPKPKAKQPWQEPKPKAKQPKHKEPPGDFRNLDLSDPDEKEAYDEGHRYYSGGNAYTTAECKEKGWI